MDATSAMGQRLSHFAVVQAPRRQPPMTPHALDAILLITILCPICGAQHWVEIEQGGEARQAGLSECLALLYGMPSPDTCGRVFALRDSAGLHQALLSLMNALATLCEAVSALDGKTIRRSLDHAAGKGPMHVVSAWASRNELVLAPCKVDAKSNECTALPELLSRLNLEGSVVTIDAMGCQVEIARQIIDHGGEYGLS